MPLVCTSEPTMSLWHDESVRLDAGSPFAWGQDSLFLGPPRRTLLHKGNGETEVELALLVIKGLELLPNIGSACSSRNRGETFELAITSQPLPSLAGQPKIRCSSAKNSQSNARMVRPTLQSVVVTNWESQAAAF